MNSPRARRATLTDSGYASVPREEEATTDVDGFWVFLEAPSTEAAEKRLLDRLRRGGIADAQAMGEGGAAPDFAGRVLRGERAPSPNPNASPGCRCCRRSRRAKKTDTAIWLDLQLKSDAPPLEGQKFPAGDAELEFRPCPVAEDEGAAPLRPRTRTLHPRKWRVSSVTAAAA